MAGGVTLLSIMTLFLPYNQLIPIHGAVQLISNSTRSLALKKDIIWPVFKWYLVGLPAGTFIATAALKHIGQQEWALLLVVALIWYVLIKPKKLPELRLPLWGFGLLAFFVGLLNPVVGATGPLQASFFIRSDWKKEQIIATKAAVQALGHILKIPAFLYLSFNYFAHSQLILGMALGVFIGTHVGVKILKKINDKTFHIIYKLTLFIASLKIIYDLMI